LYKFYFHLDLENSDSDSEESGRIINKTSNIQLKPALKARGSPKGEGGKSIGWDEQNVAKSFELRERKEVKERKALGFQEQNFLNNSKKSIDQNADQSSRIMKNESFLPSDYIIDRTRISANWLKNRTSASYLKLLLNGFYLVDLKASEKHVNFILIILFALGDYLIMK